MRYLQPRGTARASQKHDGPPKRAVLSSNPVSSAGRITGWRRPWRGWPAIPGIRDTGDRGPAGQVRRPVQQRSAARRGARRCCRARGQRHVAVEPFLRRLEAGPTRHRRAWRHFLPLRMERRPLQLRDLVEHGVHQKRQAAVAVAVRRPVIRRQHRFGGDRLDEATLRHQARVVRRAEAWRADIPPAAAWRIRPAPDADCGR